MDYNGGTEMTHSQWKWVHETHGREWFEEEEEGEMIMLSNVYIREIPGWDDWVEDISKKIDEKANLIKDKVEQITEYAVATTIKVAIETLIETAKYIDPEVSKYDETAKQQIFKTDANKSVAILLYEFATGEGEESRVFTDLSEGSFANKFLEGRVIKEIEEDFYKEIEEKKYTYDDFKKSGIKTSLEFSPDQTETYLESIRKHLDSNLPQFFIGGATITYFSTENNEFVIVSVSNPTSRRSLMLHVADNYDRENGKIIPLSTIKQNIVFKLKIDPNRFYK